MKNHVRFIVQLLAMILPASLSAKEITSIEYNGLIYSDGYESDFQVDSIFYTIHENGVYVSAEKFLYDPKKTLKPYEVAINSSYHGVITIPETVMYNGTVYNVTGIDNAAFLGCTDLDEVSIPNSVIHIGFSAFKSCSNLKEITLPPFISVIERGVFRYCSSLESISFPKNLKKIGVVSFAECSKLKSLYIPNTVECIDSLAFDKCTGLTLLSVPYSVSEIGAAPFQNCNNIDTIFWNTPDISPHTVILYCSQSLKYICLGDDITKIEPSTFWGCEQLTSITIPKKVEYIDICAFIGCHNLEKIIIEGHPTIYERAFRECWSIDSIIFKSSIPPAAGFKLEPPIYSAYYLFNTGIYEHAILSIPEDAFDAYAASDIWSYFCSLYTQGYDSELEKDDLYYTYHDTGISLGAKTLRKASFKRYFGYDGPLTPRDPNTGGLQPRAPIRDLPEKVSADSSDNATYHGNITIPESVSTNDTAYTVTGINYYAFLGCTEIESVHIPESVSSLGYGSFAGCSGLREVNIPSCVTKIPNALFYECSSLSNLEIPEGVTTIGYSAFCGCTNLTQITIPAGVELIDMYAFAYCSGLKRVIILGNPMIDETAFIGCGADLEIITTVVESHQATDPNSVTDGAVHYGIDGRRIQADAPGLHIIKRKDGTVTKALVR